MDAKKRNDLVFGYRAARERHKNAQAAVQSAYSVHRNAMAELESAAEDMRVAANRLAADVADGPEEVKADA